MRKPHLWLEQVQLTSYLNSKIRLRKSNVGKGLFCFQPIKKGELVINYSTGPGKYVSRKVSDELFDKNYNFMIQIDDDVFWAATRKKHLEDADFLNHSCIPNCGIRGKLQIVAMRDIKEDEEITIDYAMSESSSFKIMCKCGSKLCRKMITGEDWKIEELQERYRGYFSNYLSKKIFGK